MDQGDRRCPLNMPMAFLLESGGVLNVAMISLIFGCILILIGLIGGGFELKEVKIPRVNTLIRICSVAIGIMFVFIAVVNRNEIKPLGPPGPSHSHEDEEMSIEIGNTLTEGASSEIFVISIDGQRVGDLGASIDYPKATLCVNKLKHGKYSYTIAGSTLFTVNGSSVRYPSAGQGFIEIGHVKKYQIMGSWSNNNCILSLEETTQSQ